MPAEQLIVMVRGKRACACMAVAILRVEAGLRALGVIKVDLSGLVTQGAWNGGAGAVAVEAGRRPAQLRVAATHCANIGMRRR